MSISYSLKLIWLTSLLCSISVGASVLLQINCCQTNHWNNELHSQLSSERVCEWNILRHSSSLALSCRKTFSLLILSCRQIIFFHFELMSSPRVFTWNRMLCVYMYQILSDENEITCFIITQQIMLILIAAFISARI